MIMTTKKKQSCRYQISKMHNYMFMKEKSTVQWSTLLKEVSKKKYTCSGYKPGLSLQEMVLQFQQIHHVDQS